MPEPIEIDAPDEEVKPDDLEDDTDDFIDDDEDDESEDDEDDDLIGAHLTWKGVD